MDKKVNFSQLLRNIKAVAFDLDGTIYFGEQIAPGAIELVSALQAKNIAVFYFTNNSSKTKKQIYEKLISLGINTELSCVYNSAYASVVYAKSKNFEKIFCCGSPDLQREFINNGLNLVDKDDIADAIFIGLDTQFNYQKLSEVLAVVNRSNCQLIACNVDKNYPIEGKKMMPGCGAIVSAIESCTERKIDFIVGKPGAYMLNLLTKDHNLTKDEILIVGDSYDSDIAMAKAFGCKSVLISDKKRRGILTLKSIQLIYDKK